MPTSPRSRRLSRVALAAIVVVLVAAGGAWLFRHERQARECEQVTSEVRARGAGPVTTGRTTLIVIGDSWAQGAHLDRPAVDAWSTLVGRSLHATTTVDGFGGTGFASPGPCEPQSFAARAARAAAATPDEVVVEGGVNDVAYSDEQVRDGARQTLAALAGVRQVVVVGPVAVPARAQTDHVDAVLREEAAAADRQYVSALSWPIELQGDQLHPTVVGHRQFADRLLDALRP